RLRQVIRNLVSNAVKHGGEHIEILARPNEDSYLITVSDDGPGVPSELQSRVFERFVHHGSAAQSKGSVGLGLSIARLLTEGMGGSLRYERNGGKTSFLIDLPLADPNTSEAEDLGFSESDRSDPVATPS
ncbi:MAG: ATP-binding protein, partial [Acidimicrobiia bacterium]|nr:ATP-binding protein [Acidimicrobiia bacterium]